MHVFTILDGVSLVDALMRQLGIQPDSRCAAPLALEVRASFVKASVYERLPSPPPILRTCLCGLPLLSFSLLLDVG
jgi:hypothetical protein